MQTRPQDEPPRSLRVRGGEETGQRRSGRIPEQERRSEPTISKTA